MKSFCYGRNCTHLDSLFCFTSKWYWEKLRALSQSLVHNGHRNTDDVAQGTLERNSCEARRLRSSCSAHCEHDSLLVPAAHSDGEHGRVCGDHKVWSIGDGNGVFLRNSSDVRNRSCNIHGFNQIGKCDGGDIKICGLASKSWARHLGCAKDFSRGG